MTILGTIYYTAVFLFNFASIFTYFGVKDEINSYYDYHKEHGSSKGNTGSKGLSIHILILSFNIILPFFGLLTSQWQWIISFYLVLLISKLLDKVLKITYESFVYGLFLIINFIVLNYFHLNITLF